MSVKSHMGTVLKDSYVPQSKGLFSGLEALPVSRHSCWEGCLCRGTLGELLHYANLIILSDVIDVGSHCEMKFGRWSVEDSTCNF